MQTGLPREKRIFINRTLNMANIKVVGFDMDHTLALYNHETFEALAFHETLKKFIEAGYPKQLLDLEFNPNFLIRGLLVDQEHGNILRVDAHKYVKDAFHGHRRLTKDERYKLYNAQGIDAEGFLSVDTIFALSEVQIFAEIVHFMSKHPKAIRKSFQEVYSDLRQFIDLSHADGSIKDKVIKDPGKYITKDKYLATTMVRLIDAGKSLFLLTNSSYEYTNVIMSYLFDHAYEGFNHWKDYFDYIFVGAAKPGFFVGTQPFFEVLENSDLIRPLTEPMKKRGIYFGGNAHLFEKLTGFRGDELLYVGDHIYTDIIRSKHVLNWRTMLVIAELEKELPILEQLKVDLQEIHSKLQEKEETDEKVQIQRSKIAAINRRLQKAYEQKDMRKISGFEKDLKKLMPIFEDHREALKALDKNIKMLIERREAKVHPVWGELMKVGLERSRFFYQVSAYACLYTSRASNLHFYSPFKKFISFHEVLPHDV
jgi:HAD superfamily 5'-nucleotidase-like hydrolase